ncbi:FAD/NAD(P)-binding domain-containing protein [Trichodelitschia bisporula]|uniref:FAD/NAD(P)-binding domain-containing protein n=1 Tax=Trichodelitschia bisporula TaxID=703511 RepID=A0A6G1I260_9PEZI|nr:FAD/NAD(P)-binding domain-containing protein [Trichodelitschia bisporula]
MNAEHPTYPTRCLTFLRPLHTSTASPPTPALTPLRIAISGAGLAGLAAGIALARRGHTVTIFEATPALSEVGAGIQIPPNSARLLARWGVEALFQDQCVLPAGIAFRRWESGDVIGWTDLGEQFKERYGAGYWVIHRAHFHAAMYERAVEFGVEVRTAARVVEYDLEGTGVRLESGEVCGADVVVAADGIKSTARGAILGPEDKPPVLVGFAAYRATVSTDKMRADPDTAWLLDNPSINCWIGDGRHVMSYTIAGGSSFNMVLSHPESTDPSTWRQETALSDMRSHFVGWDPRLTKLISMVTHTLKWPLLTLPAPLPRWRANHTIIIGDAAHAMLPYMSQGAAMGIEDGAALAVVLNSLTSKDDIPAALARFEDERRARTAQMMQASFINGRIWHFADGPEQRARDEGMRPEVVGEVGEASPNQWSDPLTAGWCFGYDAERGWA